MIEHNASPWGSNRIAFDIGYFWAYYEYSASQAYHNHYTNSDYTRNCYNVVPSVEDILEDGELRALWLDTASYNHFRISFDDFLEKEYPDEDDKIEYIFEDANNMEGSFVDQYLDYVDFYKLSFREGEEDYMNVPFKEVW